MLPAGWTGPRRVDNRSVGAYVESSWRPPDWGEPNGRANDSDVVPLRTEQFLASSLSVKGGGGA
ncbi:hypothetical protein GCM10009687_54430 [Asanoa iriomotensis]|uniref:Uncharacterized protein n=1 Tax=Asanoa iriomotensis TaxID=234613 RepID=A0ABQ4CGB2_9ACTN|nr:hypothetical protein Air01nite_78850 [Asanoa iriomotensis]